MSDITANGPFESTEAAADAMPDIEALERAMGVPPVQRDDVGRFAKQQQEQPAERAVEPEKQPAKAEEAKPVEAAAEETEDEIELPPEKEGEAPKRIKLNEVLEKYTRAEQLEAELTKLKSDPQYMPAEAEQYVVQAITQGHKYVEQLQQWQSLNKPVPPDKRLLDTRGKTQEQFLQDAQIYAAQERNFEALTQANLAVEAERMAELERMGRQQEAVRASSIKRGQAVLFKELPELADKKAADTFKADLVKHFGRLGMTEAMINSVYEPVFYVMAKEALENIARKSKEAQVAKIVKAKPKVITGSARQAQSPAQRRSADGLAKLRENPSDMDAAVAALEGLL